LAESTSESRSRNGPQNGEANQTQNQKGAQKPPRKKPPNHDFIITKGKGKWSLSAQVKVLLSVKDFPPIRGLQKKKKHFRGSTKQARVLTETKTP